MGSARHSPRWLAWPKTIPVSDGRVPAHDLVRGEAQEKMPAGQHRPARSGPPLIGRHVALVDAAYDSHHALWRRLDHLNSAAHQHGAHLEWPDRLRHTERVRRVAPQDARARKGSA